MKLKLTFGMVILASGLVAASPAPKRMVPKKTSVTPKAAATTAPKAAATTAPATTAPAAATAAPTAPAPTAPALVADKSAKTYSKEDAMRILKLAEEIRSPETAESRVDLKTVAESGTSVYDMKILRSTGHRAHIEFLGPAEERGRRMLAKDRNYWSTFPDSNRVVAISRREMIGNSVFAVADIFQIDAEQDYTPTIVGEEMENGLKLIHLDCAARHDKAPYHRIEYWVEAGTSFPVRARFYGLSGKHLKSLFIETRAQLAGRSRPETVRMEDAVVKGRTSWWKTKTMKSAKVPDNVFTTDYLQRGR